MTLRKWLKMVALGPAFMFGILGNIEGDAGDPPDDGNTPPVETPAPDDDGNSLEPPESPPVTEEEGFEEDFLKGLTGEPPTEPPAEEKSGFIPKARFDEVNDKAKKAAEEAEALKARVAELEKGTKPAEPDPDPLEVMEDRIVDAQMAVDVARSDFGMDSEEYRTAAKSLARLNREMSRMEADTALSTAKTKDDERTAAERKVDDNFRAVATKAYEDFPFLNHEAPEANAEAQAAVVNLRDTLMRDAGMTKDAALQRAVETLGPVYAQIVKPVGETPEAKAIREAREKAAREKAAAATTSQPPVVHGRAEEGGLKLDVDKLTDKELADLPEDKKNELLGLA